MALTQLLPPEVRRRLRRLSQDVADVATALREPRRPVARIGALTDPSVYTRPAPKRTLPSRDAAEDTPAHGTVSQVLFLHHDTEISVRPGQTILQAGLEAGLDLDFSCTVGGCAACALQVVEGEVVYEGPNCLSDAERQSGMCLACVGRPKGRIVVDSR